MQQRALLREKYHRRTESISAKSSRSNLIVVPPSSIPPPLLSPTVQSPRERSRIRTNPWLSANSSGSSTTGFKSRLNLDDTSSGSGLKLTESSGSASDVNTSSVRVGRARREFKQESLSAGRSPLVYNTESTFALYFLKIYSLPNLTSQRFNFLGTRINSFFPLG